MPFKSDKQRRYLYSQKPEVARQIAHKNEGGAIPAAPLRGPLAGAVRRAVGRVPRGPQAPLQGSPRTFTGVPTGGYAAPAIQQYLAGPRSPTTIGAPSNYYKPTFTQGRDFAPIIGELDQMAAGQPVPVVDNPPSEDHVVGVDPEVTPGTTPTPVDNFVQENVVQPVGDVYEEYIEDTLLDPQPLQRETSWGTDFTSSPGTAIGAALPGPIGLAAAAGGELSRRNLENIHGNALQEHAPTSSTDANYIQEAFGGGAVPTTDNVIGGNDFYAPGDISGVSTPLASSDGFIGGTTVISGNTDLAMQQNPALDVNEDGQLTSAELVAAAEADANLRAEEEALAAARDAAERDRVIAEQQARAAEQTRLQQEAERAAREERERQENIRRANEELARSNREREERGEAQQRGSAVTDSQGRAVRDSSGGIVTDRPTET